MTTTQSFALVETIRNIGHGPEPKKAWRFLDFCVSGRALYPAVLAEGYDNTTPLWLGSGPGAAREAVHAIDQLLGLVPGAAPGKRVSVYVCPECGDFWCGALTIRLRVDEDTVAWSDWVYQNAEGIIRVRSGPLTAMLFDRREYQDALEHARVRVAGGR